MSENELKRLKKLEAQVYNNAVKKAYSNDPDQIEYTNTMKAASRAEAVGYYAGKFVVGWLIGTVIGTLLAFWVIYVVIIDPIVLPILRYIFK